MIKNKFLFIPGFQKSGTTELFYTLASLNKFNYFKSKEAYFFDLEENIVKEQLDHWYLKQFKTTIQAQDILLDASTSYAYSNWAIENIQTYCENPYILFIVRDPAIRSYSAYLHMKKKSGAYETRNFSSIIKHINNNDIYKSELSYLKETFSKNPKMENYFNKDYLRDTYRCDFDSIYENPNWPFMYIYNSFFDLHIQRWEKVFNNRVKIITFENLINNPLNTINEILTWLNIDNVTNIVLSEAKNKTICPRFDFLKPEFEYKNNDFIKKFVKKVTSNKASFMHKLLFERTEISQNQWNYLHEKIFNIKHGDFLE